MPDSETTQSYGDPDWDDTKLRQLVPNGDKCILIESEITKNYNEDGPKGH